MRHIFVLFFLLPIISFSQKKPNEKIDSTSYYIDLVKFNQKNNNYRNSLTYSQKALDFANKTKNQLLIVILT